MFTRIKRAWKTFRPYMQTRFIWSWPKQSQVLIYDSVNKEILMEYSNPWSPEILYVRGEQVNMRVLLKSLSRSGRKTYNYVDCFIEKVKPRLIVTLLDNDWHFYTISQRHPEVKTLFLQNGWRVYSGLFQILDNLQPEALRPFFVDHMLVFGPALSDKYSGYIKGNCVPVGSIKNNFVRKEKSHQKGVIAFLSQWRKTPGFNIEGKYFSHDEFFGQIDRLIIQFLIRYAEQNKKRVMIIPSRDQQSEFPDHEKAYFRKILGQDLEFLEPEGSFSGYSAVDIAEVVVAVDTTLGYESIARGNKTAIFSIRSTLLNLPDYKYGWPVDFADEGPFWTNNPAPDSFFRILDYLFEVEDEQWQRDLESTNFSSLMSFNPGNTILKEILEKELKAPPAPEH